MESARRIGDRVAMIYEGKIVWVGDVAEIDDSENAFIHQFIHGSVEGPMASLIAANASV